MFRPCTIGKIYRISEILFFANLYFVFLSCASASNLDSGDDISKIKLVGTITGKHALAILRIENQSDGIYQLNQKILNYSIKSISEKSVLLTKYNKSITLTLIPVKNRQFYDTNSRDETSIATHEYRISRNTFDSLHKNTQSWLNNVRMEIQLDNGYFTGYKITYIKKNSPAELLGLAEGDIIKGVNNVFIKQNTENFISNISKLRNANQLILNMRHKDIDFNLKLVIEENKK